MKSNPPCLGCRMRSTRCHVNCEEYKNFKSEVERLKTEKYKNSLIDRYVTERISRRFHYNSMRQNRNKLGRGVN